MRNEQYNSFTEGKEVSFIKGKESYSSFLVPDFVDIQRKSFFRLLEKGISEEFSKINPIVSDISRLNLTFYPEKFLLILPNFSVSEAILQGKTYSCKLYVPATLSGQNTKFSALARGRSKSFGSIGKRVLEASERVLEGPRPKRLQPLGPLGVGAPLRAKGPLSNTEPLSWVLLGNLPLMTKRGHFVINGSPRVLVNQLTRCPGIYFHERKWGIGKMARRIVYADFVSRRGAWLRLQADKTGEVWARLKRTPKIPFFLFYESMVASERPPFQWTFSDQAALIEMYEEVNPTKRESSAQGGKAFLDQKFRNPRTYDLGSTGRNQLNMRFGGSLISRQLTSKDLYYAFEQIKALHNHRIFADDIDNLSNRRVRAAGDLVQGQFETGLYRLEKAVVAKMRKSLADASCKTLVTTKSLNGALREFFGSSPLSQYMDQTNPLAEITQKRRISSLGPGGISRETAGMAIRGIHSTHYGRICPIETPEGKNAGLVNSLTVFTQIRKDGTLESPYYPILQGQVQNEFGFKFLAVEAEEQGFTKIAPGDINTSSSRFLPSNSIPIREAGNPQEDFRYASRETVNYIAVSPIQMISIATSLIPFLEHDDANRALMGSNMQRQAVPLLRAERPVVGTGLEALVIAASGHALSSRTSGYVSSVSNKKVVIYSKPLSFTKGKQVSPVLREKRWEASQMALEASKMVLEGPRHKGHKPFGPLALLAMQKPQVATSLVYQKSAGESLRGRRPERVKPLGSGPLQHHLRLLQEPKRFPKLFEKTGLSCIATTYFGLFEGPQDEKVLTRRSFCIANNLRRASSRNGVGGAPTQGATKFREAVGRGPLDHPSFTKIEREGPSNPYPNNEPISMSLAQSSVQDMESGLTPIECNLQSVRENYIIKQKAYIFGEVGSLKKQGLQSIKPKATGTSFTSDFCFTFREKRVAFVNRCQLVLFHSQREGLGGMTDGVGGALSIASNATTQEASTSLHFVNKMDKAFTIASNAITPRGRYFTRKSLSEQSLNFISQLRHYPLTHSIKNWLSYRSSLDCLEGLQFKEPKKIWATTVDNKNQNLKVSGFTDNHKTNQRRGLFGRLGYTSPFTMPQRTLGAPLRLERTTYPLQSYCRSNQETCLNHIPAVSEGEWVQEGDLVADCSASQFGELALGKNVLIAYLPWEGYNFEDAVVISERLVLEDVYTSIHIQKYEVETKETKFGFERITPDVPGLLEEQRGRLDEHGIAKIGSWVREGDILVGKASPKGVQLLSPYERLAYDIANVEAAKMEDTSLRVPKGVEGRVVNYHAYQEGSSLMHVFEPSLSGKGAVGGIADGEAAVSRALSIASNATTQEDGKQSKKVLIGELNMKIVPMLCGSSFKNKGVQTMLDYVMALLPSPMDKESITGTNPDTGVEIQRKPSVTEPFSALAFKIATDPYVGRLCFIRSYSGVLESGSYVLNNRSGNKERISRIFQMHANKQNQIDRLEAGDIGAVVGFKDIKTGDTLSDEKNPIVLESMVFPEPVIGYAIEPKKTADQDNFSKAIGKLLEEDPTLKVESNVETGQTIIRGMGELHLEIIIDRMRREFKVEVNQGAPQVAYKETLTKKVEHREVYKKQTGGRGKFADIVFELMPRDAEEDGTVKAGLQFDNAIVGGVIPREFIPAVEKGFREAMTMGPLAGYPIDSMKVRLFHGSFHDVDSDSLSFELAARLGFREAGRLAGPKLLEPIMAVEVLTPEEYTGPITGDLNRRRGIMKGMDSRAGSQVLKADVPLSELFGYITELRTMSSGRATANLTFAHYEVVPQNIADGVVKKEKGV